MRKRKIFKRSVAGVLALAMLLSGNIGSIRSKAAVQSVATGSVAEVETDPGSRNLSNVSFDVNSIVESGTAGYSYVNNALITYWGIDKNGVFAFYKMENNRPSAKMDDAGYYVMGNCLTNMSTAAKKKIKYVIGGLNSDMKLDGDGVLEYAFANCVNLVEVFRLPPVEYAKGIFQNCGKLEHIWCPMGDANHDVCDLQAAFDNCTSLHGYLLFGNIASSISLDDKTFNETGSDCDESDKLWLTVYGENSAAKDKIYTSAKTGCCVNYLDASSSASLNIYKTALDTTKNVSYKKANGDYQSIASSITYGQTVSDALDSAMTESGFVGYNYTKQTSKGYYFVAPNANQSLQYAMGSGLSGHTKDDVLDAGNYTKAIKSTKNSNLIEGTLMVDKCPITDCSVALMNSSVPYTGSAITNSVTAKNPYTKKTLVLGQDYTVSYSSNTNVGTTVAVINGTGNYSGSVTKTFAIVDKTAPEGSITSNITAGKNQSVTLEASDNVGVTSYYFGTSASPVSSAYTKVASTKSFSVDKTISAAGTYYFFAKDSAGNVSAAKKIVCYQTKLSSNGGKVTYDGAIYETDFSIVKVGGTTINLPVPEKKGYTFSSWDGFNGTYTINETKSLSAVYDKNTYSIIYDLNGGTAANVSNYTVEDDDIHLNAPTKQGYVFDGWTGSNGDTPEKDVVITKGSVGNRNYVANYTHIYDYNTSDDTVTIYKNSENTRSIIYAECANAKKIAFAVDVDNIADMDFSKFANLESITVNSKDADYASEGGLLYNKDKSILVYCPKKHSDNPEISKVCETIQANAFAGCTVKNVAIPYSVETVEKNAFANTNLHSVTVKNPETTLEKESIPNTTEKLIGFQGSSVASYCQNANRESYEILTTIPDDFFKDEVTMESFDIPANITSVGNNAFDSCVNLKDITLGRVQTIGSYAFNNTKIAELEIPNTVQSIGERAFSSIAALETIEFEDQSVLSNIGAFAFAKANVTEVSIPESVVLVGKGAFNGCFTLNEATFEGMNTNLTYDEISAVFPNSTVVKCYYKSKAYDFAMAHEYPISLMVGYEKDKTEEYSYVQDSPAHLVEVTVGPLLKKINAGAFKGCKNLTTISFDEEAILAEIGESAFANSGLTAIELPKTVITLGEGAFEEAESLVSVSFGGVTNVPNNAFNGCSSLTTLKDTDQFETIGENAFAGTALTEFTTGDSLISFGENAFADSMLNVLGVENPNCKFPAGPLVPNGAEIKGYTNSTADIYSQTYLNKSCTSYGKPAYVVQLNTMGGINGDEKVYVVNGKPIPPIVIPKKEDYSFVGYFGSENGGVQYFNENGKSTKIWDGTMNLTLYAVWKHDQYTVAYNGNGATEGVMKADAFDTKTNVNLTKNAFGRKGYQFLGWSTDRNATKAMYTDKDTVKDLAGKNQTVTLYAVWKPANYFITYHANGGNGTMDVQTLSSDVKQELSANAFTRTGYKFLGWSRDAKATNAEYYDKYKATNLASAGETIHLYAIWAVDDGQKGNQIAFDGNGGTTDATTLTVYEGHTITLPGFETTRDGRVFLGWSTIQGATEPEYKAGDVISDLEESITLYAVWGTAGDTSYTITTKTQKADETYEVTVATGSAVQGTNLELEANYDFHVPDGYHVNPDSVLKHKVEDGAAFMIILDRDYGKVRFHQNYAGAPDFTESEDTFIWGSKAVLNMRMPERVGYTFVGWAEEPDGTDSDIVTEVTMGVNGADVYAVWKKQSIPTNPDGGGDNITPAPNPTPSPNPTPGPNPDPSPTLTPSSNPSKPIVTKAKTGTKGKVVYQVSGKSAFVKKVTSKKLKKVTIQKTVTINGKKYKVTAIAKNAFKGCKKLKTITVKSVSLKKIGKNAIKGISKKAKIKAPKKYLKKYKKLFTKKTGFVKTMKVGK